MQLPKLNLSVNWTTVNCTRGGDKKQCQIPTWGVGTPGGGGVGHEIDKCITTPSGSHATAKLKQAWQGKYKKEYNKIRAKIFSEISY